MMGSKTLFLAMTALALSTSAMAEDDFPKGSLQISGSSPLTLKASKGGASVSLSNGDAQLVSSGGWSGELKISTNGSEVKILIPHKAYSEGLNFMAYAKDTGQAYNIRGTTSVETIPGLPVVQPNTCYYNAKTLQVPININGLTAPCPCVSANGAPVQPAPVPVQNFDVNICVHPATQAGGRSDIEYSDSTSCQGRNMEKFAQVTTIEHYKIEFFDPANAGTPVAVLDTAASPQTSTQDLGPATPCQ